MDYSWAVKRLALPRSLLLHSQETEKGNSLDVHQLTNGEWKRYIGTVEYYSAAKKNERKWSWKQ